MRIVYSCPRFDPFLGGVESHTRELASRLAARGHDVHIVTANPGGELPRTEHMHGAVVHRVHSWPRRGDPFFAPSAGLVARRLRGDILHMQSYQSAMTPFVLAASRFQRTPTLLTFHGGGASSQIRQALYPAQRRVLAPLIRRVDALIVLTEFEVALYAREFHLPPTRFVHIPNGCDLPQPSREVVQIPGVISSLGRLERSKGHEDVIRALPLLRTVDHRFVVRVIGAGADRARLETIASELGVDQFVEFRSFASSERAEMAAALLESALVISMSRSETQPIAVMEAAALGCNTSVLDSCPGMHEIVTAGVARGISEHLGPSELATTIRSHIEAPFHPQASSLISWDQCADATESLYRQLIATSGSGHGPDPTSEDSAPE